jgi:tetratricopeptide (TPR) repeat protein
VSRGLTQGEVAGEHISIAYVSRIESGSRRPDITVLTGLADRLDTTVEFLLTGTEPREADERRLTLRYVELSLESGEALDAERAARDLLDQLPPRSDDGLAFEARYLLARALESQGQLDSAVAELEQFRAASTPTHPRWPVAMIALSRCYREAGDLDRAIEIAQQAAARLGEMGLDGLDEAVQLTLTLAAAHIERGDHLHALMLCQQAADRAEELGSATLRAYAYWNASSAESERGHHDAAIALADRALALLGEGDDSRNLARLRLQCGVIMLRADDTGAKQAERLIRRARKDLAASSGSAVDLARCDVYLAQAKVDQGDLDGAEGLAMAAIEAVGPTAPGLAADGHAVLGRVALGRGDRAGLRRHYRAAAAALTAAAADRSAAQTWFELGTLLDEAGEQAAARDAFRSAAAASGLMMPARRRTPVARG